MFTLQQINAIHDQYGNPNTLTSYLTELYAIGVTVQESYISDGHSIYFGANGHSLESPPAHEKHEVSDSSNKASFLKTLELANEGRVNYFAMSQSFARDGVEKWTFDTKKMTITYYNKAGDALLSEMVQ